MKIRQVANAIIDEIAKLSDGLHDSTDWWCKRDDGTYPIGELQNRIETILRDAEQS